MKANHINASINALAGILDSTVETTMTRKKLEKKDDTHTEKEYGIVMEVNGDVNGFFSIYFDKDFALTVVDKLTGGMGNSEEIDEMGKSAIAEIGGMIKGNIINNLSEEECECDIGDVVFDEVDNLEKKESTFIISLLVGTDLGDIEILTDLA